MQLKEFKSTDLVKNIVADGNTNLKEPEKEEVVVEQIDNSPKDLCNVCGSKIRNNSNYCYNCGNILKNIPYILSKDGNVIGYVEDEIATKANKINAKYELIFAIISIVLSIIGIILIKVMKYRSGMVICTLFAAIGLVLLIMAFIKSTDKVIKRGEIIPDNIDEIRKLVKQSSNSTCNLVSENEYNEIVEDKNFKKNSSALGLILIILLAFAVIFIVGYAIGTECDRFCEMLKGCG